MSQHPEWLKQRTGESRHDWVTRTNRSCFYCPCEFENGWLATAHEVKCAKNPDRDRTDPNWKRRK